MRASRLTLVASLLAVLALAAPAEGRPDRFELHDDLTTDGLSFTLDPRDHRTILRQEAVVFENDGRLPHTIVDSDGLVEWGPIAPGESLRVEPWAAGSYRLREANEELYTAGASEGILVVEPKVGRDGWYGQQRVTVRWAARWAPDGWVYDVKYSRGGGWRWWIDGGRAPAARFTVPNWNPARSQCLGFKARLRHEDDPDRRLGWADTGVVCVIVDDFGLDR